MLSSPAARGSKGERFRSGAAANPCEAQHDLVAARARETKEAALTPRGTHRTRILEPLRASSTRRWSRARRCRTRHRSRRTSS
jgi:hypothetical protein